MNSESNLKLKLIKKFLLELSKGNFSYRLARSNDKDEYEALIALLNLTAEEIQQSFMHQCFISMHTEYSSIIQAVFFLDPNGVIMVSNPNASKILKFKEEELINKSFENLLDDESKLIWKKIFKASLEKSNYENQVHLTYQTKTALLLSAYCKVFKLLNVNNTENYLLVTFMNVASNRQFFTEKLKRKIDKQLKRINKNTELKKNSPLINIEDRIKIRDIGEQIANNPEKSLGSLKSLAIQHHTNDFKIKQGFRDLYGMTVTQYHMSEKLRKAHFLIKSTSLPIKEIMIITGFVSSAHFSNAFKKQYNYTPSSLRKLDSE